jgi:hypothetical protein
MISVEVTRGAASSEPGTTRPALPHHRSVPTLQVLRRRDPIAAWTAAALLLALPSCASPAHRDADAPAHPRTAPARAQEPGTGTALARLGTVPVKGRAPMTGYDRAAFGPEWLDADRNGCDTRNDILGRYLRHRSYDSATHGCVVTGGVLRDPYTGARITFTRGDGDDVDIDHVVSLGNAWATGAFGWRPRKRAAFANDPLNLLPADAGANRQKGDGDAATWLPPNHRFRCRYVARQVAVKAKYDLWVTKAETAAIAGVLGDCPRQGLPKHSGAPTRVPVEAPAGPSSAGSEPNRPGGSIHFENCDAARAAGAAPVRRGDPGYGPHLDRDGDGTGCE